VPLNVRALPLAAALSALLASTACGRTDASSNSSSPSGTSTAGTSTRGAPLEVAPRNAGGTGSATVTWKPGVHVIEQDKGYAALISVSTDGSTLVFDRSIAEIPEMKAGDVFVVKGLLARKVVAAMTDGNELAVLTIAAGLPDLVGSGLHGTQHGGAPANDPRYRARRVGGRDRALPFRRNGVNKALWRLAGVVRHRPTPPRAESGHAKRARAITDSRQRTPPWQTNSCSSRRGTEAGRRSNRARMMKGPCVCAGSAATLERTRRRHDTDDRRGPRRLRSDPQASRGLAHSGESGRLRDDARLLLVERCTRTRPERAARRRSQHRV
jgi:hypothetical protein